MRRIFTLCRTVGSYFLSSTVRAQVQSVGTLILGHPKPGLFPNRSVLSSSKPGSPGWGSGSPCPWWPRRLCHRIDFRHTWWILYIYVGGTGTVTSAVPPMCRQSLAGEARQLGLHQDLEPYVTGPVEASASDVQVGGTTLNDRVLVAAGGRWLWRPGGGWFK